MEKKVISVDDNIKSFFLDFIDSNIITSEDSYEKLRNILKQVVLDSNEYFKEEEKNYKKSLFYGQQLSCSFGNLECSVCLPSNYNNNSSMLLGFYLKDTNDEFEREYSLEITFYSSYSSEKNINNIKIEIRIPRTENQQYGDFYESKWDQNGKIAICSQVQKQAIPLNMENFVAFLQYAYKHKDFGIFYELGLEIKFEKSAHSRKIGSIK